MARRVCGHQAVTAVVLMIEIAAGKRVKIRGATWSYDRSVSSTDGSLGLRSPGCAALVQLLGRQPLHAECRQDRGDGDDHDR